MKKLFFIALALNALFFAWQMFSNDLETGLPLPAKSDTKENMLTLLKEKERNTIVATTGGFCYSVGPFTAYSKAMNVSDKLKSKAIEHSLQKNEEAQPAGYWLYVPASASQEETKKMLRLMHAAGIDSFTVRDGKQKNAISVGVFNSKSVAQQRAQEIIKKGFPVKVQERLETKTIYWLVLKGSLDIPKISVVLGADVSRLGKRKKCD